MTRYLVTCIAAALAAGFTIPAHAAGDDWAKVGEALGKPGTELPGGVYKVGLPRTDIKATLDGVELKPGFALGSWLAFTKSGSEVDVTKPLGTPEDLQAHEEILDATVAGAPVLPSRFGAVLTSEEAVAKELLDANHDEFAAALQQLEGRAEYIVRGRYAEQAVLEEILSGSSRAARLADRIRGADPDATRELRIQLGEIVNNTVADKRQADTRLLVSAMKDHCAASVVRSATNELDAVYAAFLTEDDEVGELERVVTDLGDRWRGRVELTVRGPMAPYDFVGNPAEAGG